MKKVIGILLGLAPLLICTLAVLFTDNSSNSWLPTSNVWVAAICAFVGNLAFNIFYKTENQKIYYYAVLATWILWVIFQGFYIF